MYSASLEFENSCENVRQNDVHILGQPPHNDLYLVSMLI